MFGGKQDSELGNHRAALSGRIPGGLDFPVGVAEISEGAYLGWSPQGLHAPGFPAVS